MFVSHSSSVAYPGYLIHTVTIYTHAEFINTHTYIYMIIYTYCIWTWVLHIYSKYIDGFARFLVSGIASLWPARLDQRSLLPHCSDSLSLRRVKDQLEVKWQDGVAGPQFQKSWCAGFSCCPRIPGKLGSKRLKWNIFMLLPKVKYMDLKDCKILPICNTTAKALFEKHWACENSQHLSILGLGHWFSVIKYFISFFIHHKQIGISFFSQFFLPFRSRSWRNTLPMSWSMSLDPSWTAASVWRLRSLPSQETVVPWQHVLGYVFSTLEYIGIVPWNSLFVLTELFRNWKHFLECIIDYNSVFFWHWVLHQMFYLSMLQNIWDDQQHSQGSFKVDLGESPISKPYQLQDQAEQLAVFV